MGRKPIGDVAMTAAERQRKYRQARAAAYRSLIAKTSAARPRGRMSREREDAEQVSMLVCRVTDVSKRVSAAALYEKFPHDLRHHLDNALPGAFEFIAELHRLWGDRKTAA